MKVLITIIICNAIFLTQVVAISVPENFAKYWFGGKAELSSYSLEQARYGEIHSGEVVLIFVTEDLDADTQIKLDDPNDKNKTGVKVLKLNQMREFNTGIYNYNLMLSVFTPLEIDKYPNTLKVALSAQEWCGTTYAQLNFTGTNYVNNYFSYFEKAQHGKTEFNKVFVEDEIWNRIRINPDSLPIGELAMFMGYIHSNLNLKKFVVAEATANLTKNAERWEYEVKYTNPQKTLSITFESNFPHKILGWEESYTSGWGSKAKKLTTRAKLKQTIMKPYWKLNSTKDEHLRQQLHLN